MTEFIFTFLVRSSVILGAAWLATALLSRAIRVTQSLDKKLDANAIAAIQQWQFEPGKKDGKAVRTAANIEVNYHLD